MLRKRVASVLVQREEKDDAPKYPKTVARKGISFLSWITVVVVGGMMISIPPTNDYLLLWTSNSLLLSTLCFNVHNEGNITSDPLARLAKIRDDVSLFGSSLQSTGISADRISLVWALDQAPNPKRFEKTLASLPQTQNPKQLYIYCGSTACLLAAKSATKDYKGAVELTRLSVPDLAQGTELQEWGDFHVLAKLMAMHHYKQHLQAAMQLAVAWKYGGSILEPGYVVTTIPTKDAICSGKAHGFSMLHSSAPKSKVIESLMKELLQVYSWNILKTIDVTTKDEDMPTSPTNWPITIDWNEILSKLKVSSFDACSSTEVDYQDSSGTHFFGSLGYDDRRRQLMSKRIRTMNIGDETQGLAGIQMLPRVDAFVERDVLHQAKFATPSLFNNATDKIVMFLNAWYGIPAMIWPPPDFLEPVTLAMHFQDRMYN